MFQERIEFGGGLMPVLRGGVRWVASFLAAGVCSAFAAGAAAPDLAARSTTLIPLPAERLRVMIETDAGGDPDDEQSLVRFLLYANEWDIEGIIANRPAARDKENLNRERTGLGIVRAQLSAYGACYPRLREHDGRYPTESYLWERTVPGYADSAEGERLVLRALESPDPRPLWFCNWGSDHGSAPSNLSRALDRVLKERGPEEYRRLKERVRLASADAFGEHTTSLAPPWSFWVDTFRPEIEGKRWYHRFSALTAKAGGFDVERDVRTGHGPLGALYPTNTTHRQKEGDTMSFLYLVPTGMNDVAHPEWGSWAGRYGRRNDQPGPAYYWASVADAWGGATNRDNTLSRWAVDLQNDFRARLDWCVKHRGEANHAPIAVINGQSGKRILTLNPAARGGVIDLDASGSSDPDGDRLAFEWWMYPEAGSYPVKGELLENPGSPKARLRVPEDLRGHSLHVLLTVRDDGQPPLASYRRIVVSAGPP